MRQPDSPRYRTVHRVPRPLLAPPLAPAPGPQRVTVVPQLPPSLRLDPLLPMPGADLAGRPGSGSLGLGGAIPGDQSPLGGSAAGRAKGLLLRQPSTGPSVSEELLITTAPLCSAGMHAQEPLTWPFALAAQPGLSQPAGLGLGADMGSAGPTPCSSPGRLVPPIFEHMPAQQVQHGGGGHGAPRAAPPGSHLGMGTPGGYLGATAGLGPALLPSGLPASALLLQGGRLGGLHAGLAGASPLGGLPSLAFNPLMLPSLGLGLSLPTAARSAGAVATPAAGGTAGDRLAAGGDTPAAGGARGGSGELQEGSSEPSLTPPAAQPSATNTAGANGDIGNDTAAAASTSAAAQTSQHERLPHAWGPSPAPSPHQSQQDWLVPAGAGDHQDSPASSGEPQHWAQRVLLRSAAHM